MKKSPANTPVFIVLGVLFTLAGIVINLILIHEVKVWDAPHVAVAIVLCCATFGASALCLMSNDLNKEIQRENDLYERLN